VVFDRASLFRFPTLPFDAAWSVYVKKLQIHPSLVLAGLLLAPASTWAQSQASQTTTVPAKAAQTKKAPAKTARSKTPDKAAPEQTEEVQATPGAATMTRVAEAPVAGLRRRDADAVAVTIPGKQASPNVDATSELLIHDFDFDGVPVPTTKLHFKELSPGVLEIRSLASQVGIWRFYVRDSANYYGLGEHFDVLNHSHQIVKNLSQDNGGPKGSSTYKPMPFFMSTTGYGLWVDTTGEATFDMNATSKDDAIVDVAAGRLRIVLFLGPQFRTILANFTALSGRAIVPPYWAFAPWKGRDFHQNDAQVLEDVDKMRALGLPASVILIDSPWASAYNNYKFNPKQFNDAPGMIKHLHEQGYKMVLWHTSWINSKSDPPHEAGFEGKIAAMSDNYAEAAGNGYFVKNLKGEPYVGRWWKGEGSLIDFTKPAAKRWWQDQVRLAIAAGADGFKDDDAEGNFIGDVSFADGSDQRVMRNRYAVLYNNAMEELIQKDLKGNGVLFARSVTAGANGIGMLWGGDNEASFSPDNGLPTVVTAGIGAGLSGMPLWATDLGGYEKTASTPDVPLLMRWTEYSAFSPVMQVMSEANISPWDFDQKTGGTRALDNYRKYSVLHMSLFPYRYAAALEAQKTGMPLMRALVLDNQNDAHAQSRKDEYLFGPDMLVAPVIDEGTSRVVYLPEHAGAEKAPIRWIQYWTGVATNGGNTIVEQAPLDTIPVWIRAGAVIPKIPEDVMTLVPSSESGNTSIKTLDDRRIFEIVGSSAEDVTETDFEGRTLVHSGNKLTISGEKKAHITLRWKFANARGVTLEGAAITAQNGGAVEFDYAGTPVTVAWR
jgi:alpha-D-xyloside xylohydrolase